MIRSKGFVKEKLWIVGLFSCLWKRKENGKSPYLSRRFQLCQKEWLSESSHRNPEIDELIESVNIYWEKPNDESLRAIGYQIADILMKSTEKKLSSNSKIQFILSLYYWFNHSSDFRLEHDFSACSKQDFEALSKKSQSIFNEAKLLWYQRSGHTDETTIYYQIQKTAYSYMYVFERQFIEKSRQYFGEALKYLNGHAEHIKLENGYLNNKKTWLKMRELEAGIQIIRFFGDVNSEAEQILDELKELLKKPYGLAKDIEKNITFIYIYASNDLREQNSVIDEFISKHGDEKFVFSRFKAYNLFDLGEEEEAYKILSEIPTDKIGSKAYYNFYSAKYYIKNKKLTEAETCLAIAIKELESELEGKSQSGQRLLSERRRDIYETTLELYKTLYQRHQSTGIAEKFIQYAEKLKSRELYENLRMNDYANEALSSQEKDDSDGQERLHKSFTEHELDLEITQSKIKEREAVVFFMIMKNSLAIAIITKENLKLSFIEQTEKELKSRLRKLEMSINELFNGDVWTTYFKLNNNFIKRNKSENKLKDFLGLMFNTFLFPLLDEIKNVDKLIFIPNGILFNFPFHALFKKESIYQLRGLDQHKGKYLIEDYAVSYLPSLKNLTHLKDQRVNEINKVLIINHATANEGDFYLHEAADDAAKIFTEGGKSVFSLTLMDMDPPDKAKEILCEFLKNHNDADLVLFYGHATFDDENAMNSGLKLSDTGNKFTAQDILDSVAFKSNPTIILNSCESGRVDNKVKLDEPYGLIRALLYSGAAKILATLWKVPNMDHTFNIMREVYLRLSKKDELSFALQKAVKGFIDYHYIGSFDHPYFWGGFYITGV